MSLDPSPERLLHHGADLIGATAGAALEFFGQVPSGAGGPLSTVLAGTLKEFASRTLSAREEIRVGAALGVAVERISARLIAGHSLRSDDFFQDRIGARAPSADIFDGVLLKARDSYEERKVRHLGLMFANLAFAQDVSFEAANLLVKPFDQLTYRQLCILALVEQNGVLDVEALRRPEHEDPEIEALKREEMDLFSNDLGTFRTHGWGRSTAPLVRQVEHTRSSAPQTCGAE